MISEFLRWTRLRWRSLFRPRIKEAELDREMRFHLDQHIKENIAAGMDPQQARLAARKEFGGVDQHTEATRDSWRPAFLSDILPDLRFSLRQLAKSPGFTAVVVLTLALGIGASTAIFSIVNSVALQPLHYTDSGRLVEIRQINPTNQREFAPAMVTVEEIQKQTTAFTQVAATTTTRGNLTGNGIPIRVYGNAVSINYFSTLGVEPMFGRTFTAEEGIEGNSNVLILAHQFWVDQFGGDPSVLSQVTFLNDQPYTIIGVMPEGFRTDAGGPKIFTPLPPTPRFLLSVTGRLKPDVTLEQAQAEMNVLAINLAAADPELWANFSARVVSLLEFEVGDISPILFVLLGAVGLLLLIACVNVANLLLARASTRTREIALRAALGASRTRVIRQLLAESILLAVLGGLLGTVLAYGGMNVLLSFAPTDMPRLDEISIDGIALLFGCGVTMLTGIGFGLVPALQATKLDLTTALKDGSRSVGDGQTNSRIRNTLVVAEIALALVLLIGAGLLSRTFSNLQKTDLGYDGEVVYADRIAMLEGNYPDNQSRINFAQNTLDNLATSPDIEAAAFTSGLPYFGAWGYRLDIESNPEPDIASLPFIRASTGTLDYFEVIGSSLIKGRKFTEQDRDDTPLVVIITNQAAQQFFGDQDPLGQRIALVRDDNREWREIVGISSDIRWRGITSDPAPVVFVPFLQHNTGTTMIPVVRVREGAANPGRQVAAAIHAVDPTMPMSHHMAQLSIYDGNSIATQRFMLFLFGVFSAVALLLAALGIFGVMSYTVSQRTNEIGVRMALGAQNKDILRLILQRASRLVGIGLIIGMAGAFAGAHLLDSVLYGVSSQDPLTFVALAAVLALIAAIACFLPARRATKVNPMVALRSD